MMEGTNKIKRYVIALAGNPNTGKSTVFNSLTGMHQHTGNWPGKTVATARGAFVHKGLSFEIVDLPGTYSLLSTSEDEEIARNFILFEQPDVTVVVTDATRLERNLNLTLQILEITDRCVVAVNLMDEAKRNHIDIDVEELGKQIGVPAIPIVARQKEGIEQLLDAIATMATKGNESRRHQITSLPETILQATKELTERLQELYPSLPNARWVALRLLDGDEEIRRALLEDRLTGQPNNR